MSDVSLANSPIERRQFHDFTLDGGHVLSEVSIAFRRYGQRHGSDGSLNKIVLVSTCFGETVRHFIGTTSGIIDGGRI